MKAEKCYNLVKKLQEQAKDGSINELSFNDLLNMLEKEMVQDNAKSKGVNVNRVKKVQSFLKKAEKMRTNKIFGHVAMQDEYQVFTNSFIAVAYCEKDMIEGLPVWKDEFDKYPDIIRLFEGEFNNEYDLVYNDIKLSKQKKEDYTLCNLKNRAFNSEFLLNLLDMLELKNCKIYLTKTNMMGFIKNENGSMGIIGAIRKDY